MGSHTPGPLEVRELTEHPRFALFTADNIIVGRFWTEADARLAASAPALLEALKGFVELEPAVEHLPEPMCEQLLTLIEQATEAIALAEGRHE